MSDQAIAEGRAAWERIKGNAKTTFSDWAFDRRLPSSERRRWRKPSPILRSAQGIRSRLRLTGSFHRTAFRTSTATSEGLRDVGLVLLILGHKNGALQFSALIFKT